MTQNNYLLTGASGFLGKILCDLLRARGFHVTGLDLFDQPINVNITQPFILNENLRLNIVVHAAGKAHTLPKTLAEEKSFYDVNLEGTKNLCNALEKLTDKPKAFIFISTVAVYGLDSGIMISEDHPLRGKTAYAKSKILAESWLTNWAIKNDIKLGILRLPLVAGPNPPGNLGTMINSIRSGHYFSIGKATTKKSIVWLDDIASIIPVVAEVGGIFNLTDRCHPSFRQLELLIANKFNKRPPLAIPILLAEVLAMIGNLFGTAAPINSLKLKKITSTLTFDDKKACELLGWKPSSVVDKLEEVL